MKRYRIREYSILWFAGYIMTFGTMIAFTIVSTYVLIQLSHILN